VPARRSAVGIQARPHAFCVSARRRGFPSHDYSWFGFIGNISLGFFSAINLPSILVPKETKYVNYLILKDYFKNWNFTGGQKYDLFCHK